jgi:hypothetical protein
MSRKKKLIFTALMLSIPPLFAVALTLGYYSFKKLEENVVYTEGFGQLDGEIGWVLRPNASARVYFRSRMTGETYYDYRVYTNRDGLRASSVPSETPAGGIAAVGDSWTFGTGVDYADTFPAQLSQKLGVPVANLGVPAHGTAQSILLLKRTIGLIAPKIVVHANFGLWARSVCRGPTRPNDILEPCFWKNSSSGLLELLVPESGHVERMSRLGVYPGGWMTAGHNTWSYYLISRPVIQLQQLLIRIGLRSGQFAEDDITTPDRALILEAALENFLAMAVRFDFKFVLLDPPGEYEAAAAKLAPKFGSRFLYLGTRVGEEAHAAASVVPAERRVVPGDGHFTGEYMSRWLDAVAPKMRAIVE